MSSVWSCSSVSDEFCFPPPARSSLPGAKPKHCYDNAEGLPWWSIVAGWDLRKPHLRPQISAPSMVLQIPWNSVRMGSSWLGYVDAKFPPRSHCIFPCLKSMLFADLTWRSIWISVLKTFSASEVSANLIKPSEIWGTRNHTEIVVWNTLDSNHRANISLIHHSFPQTDFNQGAIALWLSRLVVFDDLNLGTQMKNLFQSNLSVSKLSKKIKGHTLRISPYLPNFSWISPSSASKANLGPTGIRDMWQFTWGMVHLLFVFYMTYMHPPSKRNASLLYNHV